MGRNFDPNFRATAFLLRLKIANEFQPFLLFSIALMLL